MSEGNIIDMANALYRFEEGVIAGIVKADEAGVSGDAIVRILRRIADDEELKP